MIVIKTEGAKALADKISKMSKEMQNNIQAELNAWADDVAADAKTTVASKSSNEGNLLNSIRPIYSKMSAAVVASTSYAAYIEFGTRKFAAAYVAGLPDTWQQMAQQAKGRGTGNFKDFIASLTEWARKKGIPEDMVYPIAKKIMIEGIRERPFLYPAVNKNTPELLARLKKIIK